ncbi:hypothetical protein DFJ74DRAFT_439805 [Hyaloraphidium curvatum]|nr:hypothetical protein DFJ74DRAFT_439805 [Hyaloraphidium curvatum]
MHRNPSGPAANPIGNPAQRPRLGESPERDRGLVQQFLNHGFQGPFSAALPLLWSLFPDVITPPPLRIPRSPHLAAAMRALLSGAAAAALSALFAGPAAAQFTWGWRMGGPEEIHNEGKNPVQPWHVFPDGGISTLRGSNGNFISFWSNAENYRTEGPTALLEDQWQNVPYTPWPMIYYGGRVDYPAFYNGGRWLLSVHKHPTDGNPRHLVAFVHAEDAYWPRHIAGGPNWKSIMVSHSFDEGLTWEDRGQIITHNHPRPSDADSWDSSKIRTTTGGLGNHAAIWDAPNGRWVIIFEGNWKGVAISYDPDGNPGSWLKWNGPAEGFSQPGIGGAWARIPALQSLTGTNPMISYNEYLGRYLVMYGLWLSRGAYMVITATNDFVNWETPRVFARSVDGTRAWFPTLINEAYGSFRSAQYNWLYYGAVALPWSQRGPA